jgi:hypothetical protein
MLGFEILNPDPNGCYVRRNGGTCPRSNWERSAMGNSRDAAQTKGILAEVGIVTSNTHCWLSSECADEGGEAQT